MRWRDSARRRAEPREHEQHRRSEHHGADEERTPRPRSRERVRADGREDEDGGDGKAVAGGEVAERPLEVAEHVERRAQPVARRRPRRSRSGPASTRSVRQNGMPSTRTIAIDAAASRSLVLAQGDVDDLRGEHERAVRMRGDAQQRRGDPRSPAEASARLRRLEQREERQQAREEEEAVHPAVDPVEQQHPARRGENRRDDGGTASREPRAEHGEQREARHGEERRHGAQRAEPATRMRDRPGEDEVQRRAAALVEDGAEHPVERVAADEQRERLVLVGRPRGEAKREERRDGGGAHRYGRREHPLGERAARRRQNPF